MRGVQTNKGTLPGAFASFINGLPLSALIAEWVCQRFAAGRILEMHDGDIALPERPQGVERDDIGGDAEAVVELEELALDREPLALPAAVATAGSRCSPGWLGLIGVCQIDHGDLPELHPAGMALMVSSRKVSRPGDSDGKIPIRGRI